MDEYIGIAVRASFTYLYILLLLRLSGKRSIDTMTPLDFLVALIVGDFFDDVIWAEVPMSKGVVAMTTIILLHTLMAVATAHSKRIHDLVSSVPRLVIDHGAISEKTLAVEKTHREELYTELRQVGEDQLEEIREAYFETSGEVSALPTEAAHVVRKKDKARVKEVIETGGAK